MYCLKYKYNILRGGVHKNYFTLFFFKESQYSKEVQLSILLPMHI